MIFDVARFGCIYFHADKFDTDLGLSVLMKAHAVNFDSVPDQSVLIIPQAL